MSRDYNPPYKLQRVLRQDTAKVNFNWELKAENGYEEILISYIAFSLPLFQMTYCCLYHKLNQGFHDSSSC